MKHSSLRATRWILVNIVGALFAYVVALIAAFFLGGLLRLRFSPALGFAAFQFLFGGVFGLTIASFQSIVLDPEGPRGVRWVVFTSLGFSMGFFVANSLDRIVKGTEDSLPSFVAGIIMGLCVGIAQWLAIGPYVQRSVLWASASGISWAIAIGISGLGPILAAVTDPASAYVAFVFAYVLLLGALFAAAAGLVYGVLTGYPYLHLANAPSSGSPKSSSA